MNQVRVKKPAAAKQFLRLLLVEDSPADAEICLATLKGAGFKVTADVVEILDQFEERLRNSHRSA